MALQKQLAKLICTQQQSGSIAKTRYDGHLLDFTDIGTDIVLSKAAFRKLQVSEIAYGSITCWFSVFTEHALICILHSI